MVIHMFQGSLTLRQEKRTNSRFRFENNFVRAKQGRVEKTTKKQNTDQIT